LVRLTGIVESCRNIAREDHILGLALSKLEQASSLPNCA
jgi:hypothetical protein